MLLGKVIMELENSKGNGMSVSVAVHCVGVYTVGIIDNTDFPFL